MRTPCSFLTSLLWSSLLCGSSAVIAAENQGLQFPTLGPGATEPTGPAVSDEKYQRYLGGVGLWGDLAPMRPLPAPMTPPPIQPGQSDPINPAAVRPTGDPSQVPPSHPVVQVDPPPQPGPLPEYPRVQQEQADQNLPPAQPQVPVMPPAEMPPVPMQYAQTMPDQQVRRHTPNSSQVSFTRDGGDFSVDVEPVSGAWLIYSSTQHRPTADLYMKSVDGTTVTQLTSDPANDIMPSISPDGRYVAFASDRSGNWDIWVLPLAGGQPMQVTQHPSQELHPSWSRDGQQIVFSSLSERNEEWEMVVVDWPNTARRRHLGPGLFPRFSPDGKKIAFQRARQRGSHTFSVWTLDYMNGEAQRLTEVAAATNAALIHPTWSRDSRRLAFAAIVHPSSDPHAFPESADIWTVSADGTGLQQMTNDGYTNLQPAWGPNGQIFYISNRTGWDNIWSIRPNGMGSGNSSTP